MGLFDLLKGLLGGGSDKGKVEPAFIQGESGQVIVHRHSGFRFPQDVSEYVGVGPTQYDEKGLDVSVGYNHAKLMGLAVTVYVYPDSGGPGSLAGQYEGCKAEVSGAHASVKVLSEEVLSGAPNGTQTEGRKALFSFEDELGGINLSSLSELWLFSHKGFFIKFRASYPDSMKPHAPQAVVGLIKELSWP
ncbi:MAG: hypothetical protein HY924_12910 [Elusimicrobia bacterium]|nr:hypothetical protein [Elusimicrobiota bacterium]